MMKLNSETKLTNTEKTKTAYYRDEKTGTVDSKEFPVFELIILDRRIFNNMSKQLGITKKALHKLMKKDSEVKQMYLDLKQEFESIGE